MRTRVKFAGKCKTSCNMGVHGFSVWKAVALSVTCLVVFPLAALPFYKSGCEPTEPVPASSVPSSTPAPLDSRAVQSAISEAVAFDSDSAPGVLIIVM